MNPQIKPFITYARPSQNTQSSFAPSTPTALRAIQLFWSPTLKGYPPKKAGRGVQNCTTQHWVLGRPPSPKVLLSSPRGANIKPNLKIFSANFSEVVPLPICQETILKEVMQYWDEEWNMSINQESVRMSETTKPLRHKGAIEKNRTTAQQPRPVPWKKSCKTTPRNFIELQFRGKNPK